MNNLYQKWKVKLIFRGAYQALLVLSGTGIVACLEIIEVGCNLKQSDGLTPSSHDGVMATPRPPYFATIYSTGCLSIPTRMATASAAIPLSSRQKYGPWFPVADVPSAVRKQSFRGSG